MFGFLRDVRIKTFSNVLIVFIVTAGVVVGVVSLSTLRQVENLNDVWAEFANGPVEKTRALSRLRDAIGYGGFIHHLKNAVLRGEKEPIAEAGVDYERAVQAIEDYRSIGVSEAEASELNTIESGFRSYYARLPRLEQMIDQGLRVKTVDDYMDVDERETVAAMEALAAELQQARAAADSRVDTAVANAQASTYLTLGAVAFLILSLIVSFLWFAQSRLISPIYRLMDYVNGVGAGDLTKQIPDLTNDEVGTLGARLNEMVANLKEITIQTRAAVGNLNSAAAETLASTKQQSASVEEQFAALQETTATLDEINQSGQQMSNRAKEIAVQAEKASEVSRDGLRSMDDMAQVMDAIEEQTESVAEHIVALSEKTQAIGEIISSVDDIAERSQLLALNAAIEAATAGEHGRTFAVVADEIKTLADQAKEATNQVSSILGEIQKGINSSVMSTEESVKRVASGREQTEATLASIKELAATIEASVQAFEQVVASTNQQRVGLDQVSAALQQIRAGSEQTAAGTKQIEQAVSNIGALGGQLGHTMERYAV